MQLHSTINTPIRDLYWNYFLLGAPYLSLGSRGLVVWVGFLFASLIPGILYIIILVRQNVLILVTPYDCQIISMPRYLPISPLSSILNSELLRD